MVCSSKGSFSNEIFVHKHYEFDQNEKSLAAHQKSPVAYRLRSSALTQCFSTAGTRPGTGTWRPSYRDLNYF